MAQRTELEVTPRTVMGKGTRHLRKKGLIPANIYGHKEAPMAIQLDAVALDRLRREHSTRNILSLRLPNGTHQTALLRHVQRDACTGKILHVDFTRVSLRERIAVKVPLHFVGEAPGVKIQGGMLLPLLDAIEVECRASDIENHIDVDISSLAEFDAALHAKDIPLPKGYSLITDAEEPIVKIQAPRTEAAAPEAVERVEAPVATPEPPAES